MSLFPIRTARWVKERKIVRISNGLILRRGRCNRVFCAGSEVDVVNDRNAKGKIRKEAELARGLLVSIPCRKFNVKCQFCLTHGKEVLMLVARES